MFEGIEVACCQGPMQNENCLCGTNERVLHAYSDGRYAKSMTPEQREWCIRQADESGEGYYHEEELRQLSDKDLARSVLHAWKMYVDSHF